MDNTPDLRRLSRLLSLILRHHPEEFGVSVDASGWASVDELIKRITAVDLQWRGLHRGHVEAAALLPEYERFELKGPQIRALYGHSSNVIECNGEPTQPPSVLFHVTTSSNLDRIREEGLVPNGRRFVHLTSSWHYAQLLRATLASKRQDSATLSVDTERAPSHSIRFTQCSSAVWVTPHVPSALLSLVRGGRFPALKLFPLKPSQDDFSSLASELDGILGK
jgi:putative RNA 2'-phosphotransferase